MNRNEPIRVARAPSSPLMVFDGECEFCLRWIERWKKQTGGYIDYESYQNVADNFPEIPLERFHRAVQLIDIDGIVYGGAEAVFRAFKRTPSRIWLWRFYNYVPVVRSICERVYNFIASRR